MLSDDAIDMKIAESQKDLPFGRSAPLAFVGAFLQGLGELVQVQGQLILEIELLDFKYRFRFNL